MDKQNLMSWEFALFSAHINRFLPYVYWVDHPELYNRWKSYHQAKAIRTDECWDIGEALALLDGGPRIVCLYHLGYHAQIPRLLTDMGLHFDLILDRDVYNAQRRQLDEMQHYMQSKGKDYRFLMSDDPNVLLQVRAAIRAGKHILVFADGNSGAKEDLASKVKIDFLASSLFVRKGIAVISHLLQIPVVPLLHRYEHNGLSLQLGKQIHPQAGTDRDVYIQDTMFTLYQFLADKVYDDPYIWESWGYMHELNCLDVNPLLTEFEAEFAGSESLIKLPLAGYMGYFDRKRYCFYY
jgi:lauroyl/myristoyl acyltransferase